MTADSSQVLNGADEVLDLRGTPCPLNFVKTKLRLQRMPVGAILEVWLDPGEPMEQVPDSLRVEGFEVLDAQECDSYWALRVRFPQSL
jgi:TusA-related sulfurtransferase